MAKLTMTELSNKEAPGSGVLRVPGEIVYHVYRPADSLENVTVGGRALVRFGSTGACGSLLLDASSGNVMESLDGKSDVNLVNTSLDAFNRSLEAFFVKFPLDDIEDEEEAEGRDNRVAREIENDVRLIDPEAYSENSFWYEVRWSVAIGDFSD